jgi:hypothetical protein
MIDGDLNLALEVEEDKLYSIFHELRERDEVKSIATNDIVVHTA